MQEANRDKRDDLSIEALEKITNRYKPESMNKLMNQLTSNDSGGINP